MKNLCVNQCIWSCHLWMFPQHVAVQISPTSESVLTLNTLDTHKRKTRTRISGFWDVIYVCFRIMWFFKALQLLNLCSHQIHLTHHLHLKIIYENSLNSKIVFKTACGCSNLFNFWICPHFKNFTKFWISRPETLQTYGIFCHHNASKTQIWDVLFTTSSLLFIVIWQCL